MNRYKYLILGGGTSSGYAVKEMVRQGVATNEIGIISKEGILPMDRPPLSKEFLRKKDGSSTDVEIENLEFYNKHNITILNNTKAVEVLFNSRQVKLDNGTRIGYDKLLLATGTRPKKLHVPGSNKEGIFYLRSFTDASQIKKVGKNVDRAVVIGDSFIATETAASLAQKGCRVTMVINKEYLFGKLATPEMGEHFNRMFRKKGIEIIQNARVAAFTGQNRVSGIRLTNNRHIETDMVVAGIGVMPNTELFENSGLELCDGIVVNEFCETNMENVYCAGDVARFPDLIFGGMRRVDHWENAMEMGKKAAKTMVGYKEPYVFLPYFFGDFFNLSYDFFGDNSLANGYTIKGRIENNDFAVFWFNNNQMTAAFLTSSRPEEEREAVKEWITNKVKLNTGLIKETQLSAEEVIV